MKPAIAWLRACLAARQTRLSATLPAALLIAALQAHLGAGFLAAAVLGLGAVIVRVLPRIMRELTIRRVVRHALTREGDTIHVRRLLLTLTGRKLRRRSR